MTHRLVLDASAALHVVIRSERAVSMIPHLQVASIVTAPRLYCSEVANGLWKYVKFGELSRGDAVTRLEEALSLIDTFECDESLAVEALGTAVCCQHPVYDALYLTLARRVAGVLMTQDHRLSEVARQSGVECLIF